ncbi:MAG: motif domain protein, partial [Betaproteobacteria bacterium]|nr:motif domain protein [Betaproteobacteria bacterium]
MTSAPATYSDESLRTSTVADLMRLLARDEDRVPRNVVEECVRRGDEMLDAIAELLEKDYYWEEDQTDGEWWRLLHAVMILGRMDSARAGDL